MREKKGVRMISKNTEKSDKSLLPASNKSRIQQTSHSTTSETHYNSIIDRYLFGIPTYDLYKAIYISSHTEIHE